MDSKTRLSVLNRDNETCQACGNRPANQVHHIKPRGCGGEDTLTNLVTLCGRCHMIISPVPPHALWNAFRVRKSVIPHAKKRVEKAIERFQQRTK